MPSRITSACLAAAIAFVAGAPPYWAERVDPRVGLHPQSTAVEVDLHEPGGPITPPHLPTFSISASGSALARG